MEQFKRAKVVILPTNEPSKIGNLATYQGRSLAKVIKEGVKPINTIVQFWNLYIISDDEIKEGDRVYENNLNTKANIYQVYKRNNKLGIFRFRNVFVELSKSNCKKIIATTDTSLEIVSKGINPVYEQLPKPSKQFIQKYIEEYNKDNIITDVLVEYEIQRQCVKCKTIRSHYLCKCGEQDNYENTLQLKINPKDNTITIKKVKEIYTKEEVYQILEKYTSFIWNEVGIPFPISLGIDAKDKFINCEL